MTLKGKTSETLRGSLLAAAFACLAVPAAQAGGPECGQPVATQSCDAGPGGAGCGILYLQISNLVEDGPVLNGLSLSRSAPEQSRGPAQCAAAAAGPLPPADPGSPDRDCVAYLVPACTYGIQARFGDGSRSSADGIRIAPQQNAETVTEPACAKVTLDLGRQHLSSDVPEDCGADHGLTASLAAADLAAPGLDRGSDGGNTGSGVTTITVSDLQDGNRKGSGVFSE